jgi:hypothetical protein
VTCYFRRATGAAWTAWKDWTDWADWTDCSLVWMDRPDRLDKLDRLELGMGAVVPKATPLLASSRGAACTPCSPTRSAWHMSPRPDPSSSSPPSAQTASNPLTLQRPPRRSPRSVSWAPSPVTPTRIDSHRTENRDRPHLPSPSPPGSLSHFLSLSPPCTLPPPPLSAARSPEGLLRFLPSPRRADHPLSQSRSSSTPSYASAPSTPLPPSPAVARTVYRSINPAIRRCASTSRK